MATFEEFLAFGEELNEVTQAFDEAVVHLLPPPPDQQHTPPVVPQHGPPLQDNALAAPPGLLDNSESEPESDDEMDQGSPLERHSRQSILLTHEHYEICSTVI